MLSVERGRKIPSTNEIVVLNDRPGAYENIDMTSPLIVDDRAQTREWIEALTRRTQMKVMPSEPEEGWNRLRSRVATEARSGVGQLDGSRTTSALGCERHSRSPPGRREGGLRPSLRIAGREMVPVHGCPLSTNEEAGVRMRALTMTRLLLALLVLIAAGCTGRDHVAPADSRELSAPTFSLMAPTDTSWTPRSSAGDSIVIVQERTGARLVAWGYVVDPAMADGAFAAREEALQEERLLPMEMLLSKHYNRVNLRQAECLQYDGVFRDHEAAEPSLSVLALKGYACRHPLDPGLAVLMEFAIWSGPAVPPELEALLRAADEVFLSVAFTEPY